MSSRKDRSGAPRAPSIPEIRARVSLSDTARQSGVEIEKNGEEWIGCCPFHEEHTPSFTIRIDRSDQVEKFKCFGCGAAGDVIDFVEKIKGVSTSEAIRLLGEGIGAEANVVPAKADRRDPYEKIEALAPPQDIEPGGRIKLYNPKRAGTKSEWGSFVPALIHPYRKADSSLFGYVLRHDLPDGGKETPMVQWARLPSGVECWCRLPFAKPRPLYGLERLRDDKQVTVVEGEKCADALWDIRGRAVVTWPGGVNGVSHVDWSTLRDRDVVIWPDADAPGYAAAKAVGSLLSGIASRVRYLDVFSLNRRTGPGGAGGGSRYPFSDWLAGLRPASGFDAADCVAEGWSKDNVTSFMKQTVTSALPGFPELIAVAPIATSDPSPGYSPQPAPAAAVKTAPAPPARVLAGDVLDTLKSMALHATNGLHGLITASEVDISRVLAEALKAAFEHVVFAEGRFWVFAGTAWREIARDEMTSLVQRYDGQDYGAKNPIKLSNSTVEGILKQLAPRLVQRGFFDQPAVALNADNTVIAVEPDGKIVTRSHSPDDKFRFTIPASFELHTDMHPAEGSMLHRLLYGAFEGDDDAEDKIRLVGEILGAAAFGYATRLPQPKAFVFLGETASNGKSTIASLLSCLLPEGAVSHIPPSAFEDEKRIINLAGKAANVADELSGAAMSGENFKKAVTGNPIEGRDLYRSAVTFTPRAILVSTTNTLPRFNGGLDRGLQRRLVVLRFNKPIDEKSIIPDIADRIRRDELDTLLGMAIAGAQRLMRNRAYTIPASSIEALRGWLLLDPVNEWFEERTQGCEQKPMRGWPTTRDLFKDFKEWAAENGHADRFLPPVNTFSQRLKAMPGVQLLRSHGVTKAIGVDLRERGVGFGSF